MLKASAKQEFTGSKKYFRKFLKILVKKEEAQRRMLK